MIRYYRCKAEHGRMLDVDNCTDMSEMKAYHLNSLETGTFLP